MKLLMKLDKFYKRRQTAMIKFENRFDEYAYRLAMFEVDPSVDSIEEGQFVTLKNGKIVLSDGTKKSFIAMGSMRNGRDQVGGVPVKKIAILHGNYVLSTDQFDPIGTYGDLTPLTVGPDAKLKPAGASDKVVAYSVTAPVDGFLRIISA
ncbi:MAG: hypothetical protein N2749_00685 [Clostridia bacterium]|nr:hypothetical protein [Clostridia bacterium]